MSYGAWAVRLTLTGGVAVLAGVGCGLVWDPDSYRAHEETWSCSTTVRDAAGAPVVVSGDDETLQGALPREFLSHPFCTLDGKEAMEEDFLRWVHAALPDRFDGRDGPWCVDPVPGVEICELVRSRPKGISDADDEDCLTPIPEPAPPCGGGERCLAIEPPVVDFETILEGMGLDGRSPVGFTEDRVRPAVEVRNTCDASVRVLIDDEVQGASPEDFAVIGNTCAPRSPDEERLGRPLAGAGMAEDTCGFEIEFTPTRHARARTAEKRFSQDTTELYSVPLSGRARGGRLGGLPMMRCFDALVGPQGGCANATAVRTLTPSNIDPGRLTVESIVATGQFQVAAPATPFVLEPGASFNIDVWWCGDDGDFDEDASLVITDNGFNTTTEILLQRRMAGCP
jgi:hypothetical protein